MKKIKLFDRGIFAESFRRIRLPGILFAVIFSLESILIFISALTTKLESAGVNSGAAASSTSVYYSSAYTSILSSSLLSIFYLLMAPILTITAFRFLSKRNASDIYHSLPHKRATIFISIFSSIAAWLGIIIIGSSLLNLISAAVLETSFSTFFSTWAMYTLSRFIASLFIASCFAIAVTITGTLGSNVIVGCLITFVPRLIISSITSAITSALPILSSGNLGFFLENKYNLVTSFSGLYPLAYLGLSSSRYSSSYNTGVGACVYTFVLSLLYIAAACVLFRFRKSESASQSAPNRKLQATYRIALCMVVCIFVVTSLFNQFTNGSTKYWYNSIIWYIVAIVIYFAYELITTRRFKNLVKALPGLGIVVILNFAIYGIMAGARSYELSYSPDKQEISSVAVSLQSSSQLSITNSSYSNQYSLYVDQKTLDIDLNNEEIISIVADSLRDNADTLKQSRDEFNRKFSYNNYNYNNDSGNGFISTTVKINTNFGSKYRQIYIARDKLIKIKEAYYNNGEYREMYKQLPKGNKGTIYINNSYMGGTQLKSDDLFNIYDKVREEIAGCDFDTLYDKMNKNDSMGFRLNYSYNEDNRYYSVNVPINKDLTPKSYEMLLEKYYSATKDNLDKVNDYLDNYNKYGNDKYSISIQIYNSDSNSWSGFGSDGQSISFIRNNKKDGAPKIGDSFAIISIYERYGVSKQIQAIINLGDASPNNMYKSY